MSERDASGRTALHYCVDNTTSQVAELLVTSDQTLLTSADSDGLTPLHLAVMAGNAVLVRFLLQKGAPVTTVDGEGHGIVHWAIGKVKIKVKVGIIIVLFYKASIVY